MIRKLLNICVFSFVAFVMAACGAGVDKAKLQGRWGVTAVERSGRTATYSGRSVVMTIKEDLISDGRVTHRYRLDGDEIVDAQREDVLQATGYRKAVVILKIQTFSDNELKATLGNDGKNVYTFKKLK